MLLLLLACAEPVPTPPSAPAPAPRSLRFEAIAPEVQPDGTAVLARLRQGDRTEALVWTPLLVQGQAVGEAAPFGTLVDARGQALPQACRNPDGNGLLQAHGQTWLFTHLECSPAGLQQSRLARGDDGAFRVEESALVDLSAQGGFNQLCAGEVSPWGSFLGAEEYETDAALLIDGVVQTEPPGRVRPKPYSDRSHYADFARFSGTPPSPYVNGWILEARVLDAQGRLDLGRRYALGRFSHELARVMPDRRTVYLSDDQDQGILAMFVADRPDDLRAGVLYAARWQAEGEGARLAWISLGHAREEEIAQAVAAGTTFADLFDRQPMLPEASCPEGYTAHREPQDIDACLRLRSGMGPLASRLETRRAAALLGATTEFSKEEGLALDAQGKLLYVAFSHIADGMLAQDPPWPERDHVTLPESRCGGVWSFALRGGAQDSAGQAIDSDWVATRTVSVLGSPARGLGGCDPLLFQAPDNLAFIDGAGILLVAEDNDRDPNRLWAVQDGQVLPLFAAPGGDELGMGEVSGLGWFPSVEGAGWISLSVQHPGRRPAVMGLLGPLPAP